MESSSGSKRPVPEPGEPEPKRHEPQRTPKENKDDGMADLIVAGVTKRMENMVDRILEGVTKESEKIVHSIVSGVTDAWTGLKKKTRPYGP
jgi:hypothetical protein